MVRFIGLSLFVSLGIASASLNCATSTQVAGATLGGNTGIIFSGLGSSVSGCLTVDPTADSPASGLFVNPDPALAGSPTNPNPTYVPNYAPGAGMGDLGVSWTITQGAGFYTYSYTVQDNPIYGANLAHTVLGISANCTAIGVGGCISNPVITYTAENADGTVNVASSANKTALATSAIENPNNIPNQLLPAGFNTNSLRIQNNNNPPGNVATAQPCTDCADTETFTFTSTHAPVYQDFYQQDGDTYPACGALGAADRPCSIDAYNNAAAGFYILAPDTSTVPEPGFYGLLAGAGLFCVSAVRRRRKAL